MPDRAAPIEQRRAKEDNDADYAGTERGDGQEQIALFAASKTAIRMADPFLREVRERAEKVRMLNLVREYKIAPGGETEADEGRAPRRPAGRSAEEQAEENGNVSGTPTLTISWFKSVNTSL